MSQEKFCAECGAKCDGEAAQCWQCGHLFADDKFTANQNFTGAVNSGQLWQDFKKNGRYQNSFEGFTPDRNYERKSKKRIVLIIVAAVLAIVLPAIAGRIINMRDDKGDIDGVDYSKGELRDNVFYNEWANIKVEIPNGWQNASEAEYKKLESGYKSDLEAECGLYIKADNNQTQFYILFASLGKYGGSEKAFLDEFEKGLKSYATIGDKGTQKIAGQYYSYLEARLYGDVYSRVYFRIKGKRVIMITTQGTDKNYVEKFINCVTAIQKVN